MHRLRIGPYVIPRTGPEAQYHAREEGMELPRNPVAEIFKDDEVDACDPVRTVVPLGSMLHMLLQSYQGALPRYT
jgi:hypothetical protein